MAPHAIYAPGDRPRPAWWKESSVYQIYPASFQDSTGSGSGDLGGIVERVDYIHQLGVDIVWICPIFESPQVDMGYDVSNYRKIDKRYGTLEDLDALRDKLHDRGMKLVLDMVFNHTSDQHEWFKQARSSKDNEYRDWYIWRPPRYDSKGHRHPPNNWESHFSGSAWEYDEATDEYYLHLFTKEQPDLNWENPHVRTALDDIMRFWLERGVDGFRLDVINFISKNQSFPDSDQLVLKGSEYYAAGPRLHEFLKGIGDTLNEYHAFSVGEMPCVYDPEEILKSVGADRGELSMIFHFDFVTIDYGPKGKFSPREWTISELATIADKWQRFMYDHNGWNALYVENHDQPRSVSRYACDCPEHRVQSAKVVASFIGLQAGTLFVYQGQELGMVNVPKEWPLEEYKDVEIWNHWEKYKHASPEVQKAVKEQYQKKGRDSGRTPMQWDAACHAGFTAPESEPWIRVNPSYHHLNAAAEVADPNSTFHFWRRLLAARKLYKDVFVYGDFALEAPEPNDSKAKVMAYRRIGMGRDAYVVCNFGKEMGVWEGLPKGTSDGTVILGSLKEGEKVKCGEKMELEAFETVVVLVQRD